MQAVDTSYWKEYGNNYFRMAFVIDGTVPIELDAVLTEIPSISMSCDWEESPVAAIGSLLSETLNNDLVEFLGQGGGTGSPTDYVHQVQMDRFTSRVFKDGSPLSFDLKFRVYSGQRIGSKSMSSAKKWMASLAAATPVHSSNGLDLSNTLDNLGAAIDGLKAIFDSATSEATEDDLKRQGLTKDSTAAEIVNKSRQNIESNMGGNIDTKQDEGFLGIFGGKSEEENMKANQAGQAITAMNKSMNVQNVGVSARLARAQRWGANLFELRILPFFFIKPLIVYVSDWSVTPSREFNETLNESFYYDFMVTCKEDQTHSAKVWQEYIGK